MKKKELIEKIAKLETELFKAKTQLNMYQYELAYTNLGKSSKSKMLGSGIILSLKKLNGEDLFEPICIADGLSEESIEALRKDIINTIKEDIGFKTLIKRINKGE